MSDDASPFAGAFAVESLAETEDIARRVAMHLGKGDTVAFEGDLGAGKTTFVRAMLRAMGVRDDVPSPTFTLVQEYEAGGLRIAHCDLYRIERAVELDEIGMDELLRDGVVLVEWPERAESRIPADALRIRIDITGETARRIALSGPARWAKLLTERA